MSPSPRKPSTALLVVAWAVTLLASALPTVLWTQFTGATTPGWIYYFRVGLPLLLIFLSAALPLLIPLRYYFFLLAVVNLGYWLVTVVRVIVHSCFSCHHYVRGVFEIASHHPPADGAEMFRRTFGRFRCNFRFWPDDIENIIAIAVKFTAVPCCFPVIGFGCQFVD